MSGNKRQKTTFGSQRGSNGSQRGSNNSSSSAAGLAASSSRKAPRPKNFIDIEDQVLCRAYVNQSTNPAVGTDQKLEVFYGGIKTKFEELLDLEDLQEQQGRVERSAEALMN